VNAGLVGRTYAIDASLAAFAPRQQRPVVMLTSDVDGMTKLRGE